MTGPAGARPARAWALAAALSVAAAAAFFAPALAPSRQFGYFDNGRMHVPMKRWIAEELRAGRFPAWNPHAGLGMPVAAGAVDAPQHPFNALLLALPFDLGFKLWVLLCFPIAALGARALARRLGAGQAAATAAGLCFMLSGYPVSMTGNMQYLGALAFFPWILAAGLWFAEAPGPGRAALAALASGLCAASGDPQGWAIAVGLVPLAALAAPPPGCGRGRAGWRALGAVAAAAVGALPFVLPVAAWIPASGRGEPFDDFEYRMFNLLPPRALELAVPGLFGVDGQGFAYPLFDAYGGDRLTPLPWALSLYLGAPALALALLGAARRPAARWLLLGAAVATWMAMGHRAGFGQLARHLPLLSGFRYWEKLAAWPALLLAAAAALGVEALLADRALGRRLGRGALAAAAALAAVAALALAAPGPLAAALAPPAPPAEAAATLVANLRAGALQAGLALALLGLAALAHAAGRLPAPAVALGALLALDLAAANARAYRLSDVEATRPPSPLAAALRAREPSPRLLTPFGLYQDGARYTQGMEPASRLGAELLYAAWNVPERIGNFQAWSGMLPVRFNRYWRRMGRPDRLPGVGMWGYRWLYVPGDKVDHVDRLLPPGAASLAVPGVPGSLRELPWRPRAYLAGELAEVDRRGAMEFVLDADHVATGRSVVEAPLPAGYRPPRGEASLVVDEPARVELAASADAPALLVLNDIFTEGWAATVDGAPAPILPANYLARGVWIGPGSHRVVFSYRTPWLRESWLLVAAAGLAAAAWAWRRRAAGRGA
jgi:hypothetical protein